MLSVSATWLGLAILVPRHDVLLGESVMRKLHNLIYDWADIGIIMSEQLEGFYRGGGDSRSIAQRLGELKSQGCVTVATGEAKPEAFQAVCRRMFGDPHLDRRRLLVTFKQDSQSESWLPADLTPAHRSVMIRDRSDAVRRVMETVRAEPTSEAAHEVARPHLDAVAGDVLDAAGAIVAPQPGQLRVVVLRPDYLFPDPDKQQLSSLTTFVDRLRTLMQRFSGMVLLVVPETEDSRVAERLSTEADVHFEVRSNEKFVEQRVIIAPRQTDEVSTDWHTLP